jgi:hypothetical protein
MGYQRPTIKLVFADDEFAGLEVRVRRLSVEGMLAASALVEAKAAEKVSAMATLLAGAILTWNLEDDTGTALPVTPEVLLQQDMGFMTTLLNQIMEVSGGVSPPLPAASPAGEPCPEESIPMETLSPSPAS